VAQLNNKGPLKVEENTEGENQRVMVMKKRSAVVMKQGCAAVSKDGGKGPQAMEFCTL
jgi:hypothetical protein